MDLIAEVEAAGGDAPARLWRLMEGLLRLDPAVQDGRYHLYLMQLFGQMGFNMAASRARARFVYHAVLGESVVGTTAPLDERLEDARAIHALLVSRDANRFFVIQEPW